MAIWGSQDASRDRIHFRKNLWVGGVKENRVLNNQAAPQYWKRQNNLETKAIKGYALFYVYSAMNGLVHDEVHVKW